MPIPKLEPKVTTPIPLQEEVNAMRGMGLHPSTQKLHPSTQKLQVQKQGLGVYARQFCPMHHNKYTWKHQF